MPNQEREDGSTPLFASCQEGHHLVVLMLALHSLTDVNHARNDGVTPAWIAAQKGHILCLKYLLAVRRDVDLSLSPIGEFPWAENSPREQALLNGHLEIAAFIEDFENQPLFARRELRRELGFYGLNFLVIYYLFILSFFSRFNLIKKS